MGDKTKSDEYQTNFNLRLCKLLNENNPNYNFKCEIRKDLNKGYNGKLNVLHFFCETILKENPNTIIILNLKYDYLNEINNNLNQSEIMRKFSEFKDLINKNPIYLIDDLDIYAWLNNKEYYRDLNREAQVIYYGNNFNEFNAEISKIEDSNQYIALKRSFSEILIIQKYQK